MNSLFATLGIESWKPVITALVLPPVPFLVLVLIGARLLLPRRGLGWLVILISVVLLWLSACTGAVRLMSQLLPSPPALSFDRVRELRAEAAAKKPLAIVSAAFSRVSRDSLSTQRIGRPNSSAAILAATLASAVEPSWA